MTGRFLNGLVLVLVLGLGLTSSYKIDDPYPSEKEMDTVEDMTDEMNKLDELNDRKKEEEQTRNIVQSEQAKDIVQSDADSFIEGKWLHYRGQCKLDTKNKIPEKEIAEKKIAFLKALRKNYQILQHGKGSIADDISWLAAKRSEVCGSCVLKKICSEQDVLDHLNIDQNLSNDEKERACILKILEYFRDKFHVDEAVVNCNANARFRRIDGRCNNLENPLWGSVGDKFLRLAPADYGDGVSSLRRAENGDELPNARNVSRFVHGSNDCSNPDNSVLTHLTMNIGQFMDHDITLAEAQGLNCEPYNPNPECINIEVPDDDDVFLVEGVTEFEFERDAPHKPATNCTPLVREHSNTITCYIDASNVYGSTRELAQELRAADGRLLVMKHPHGCPMKSLLPAQPPDVACESRDPLRPCFHAGDERVNENQGLMSVHTIFVREHNRMADFFGERTQWPANRIYQEVRKIVGAELQVITYREFLPELLSRDTIDQFGLRLLTGTDFFTGYDRNINAQMSTAFSVAAYRFGHSLIQNQFRRFSQEGFEHKCDCDAKLEFLPISLCDFGNPTYLYDKCQGGVDSIFRGLIKDPAATIDRCLVECVQHALRRGEGDRVDLASLNIQRGRDRGMPGYTTYRNLPLCNISRKVNSFDDLKAAGFSEEIINNFKKVYNSVNDIELFPGGLSEPPSEEGGLLGPTFQCIIAEQFKRLRVGDRFWHENEPNAAVNTDRTAFTACQLREIRKITLAKVICANGDDIPAITRRVLRQSKIFVECDRLPDIDLTAWLPGYNCPEDSNSGASADSKDDAEW